MLHHRGRTTPISELKEQIYIPGREGSLQFEMLAGVRRAGLLPLPVDGQAGVVRALQSGDPVMVLQRLRLLWRTNWHYAVVVGYDAAAGEFVLQSGTERRKRTSVRTFDRTWRAADDWGYTVVAPGTVPDYVSALHYFVAVAGLEQAGHLQAALNSFSAAAERWPDDPRFVFGQANVYVQLGKLGQAVERYQLALKLDPAHHEGGEQPSVHTRPAGVQRAVADSARKTACKGRCGARLCHAAS